MKNKIAVLALILFSSCSVKLLMPTGDDTQRAASKFPGTTTEDLVKGKALYEEYCTQCHGAKKPSSESEEHWRKLLPGMSAKAAKKDKKVASTQDQDLILRYLVTMSEHHR